MPHPFQELGREARENVLTETQVIFHIPCLHLIFLLKFKKIIDTFSMGNIGLDQVYMEIALKEAEKAAKNGEVPVGAILVKEDQIIAKDHNRCIELNDPTAHAEILVLRKGGEILRNYRLKDTIIYVTAEPCPMCASAMVHGRILRLVFGAFEPKFGAVVSKFKLLNNNGLNHKVIIDQGILEKECTEIMRSFFKKRRGSIG